jgi:hypothetical protein
MEFQDSIWQKTHTELVKEAKKEGHDEAVEKVKGRIGFLRQWLNERPSDFIVTNEVIEAWLLEASPLDEIK